jgi:hypothetical protein
MADAPQSFVARAVKAFPSGVLAARLCPAKLAPPGPISFEPLPRRSGGLLLGVRAICSPNLEGPGGSRVTPDPSTLRPNLAAANGCLRSLRKAVAPAQRRFRGPLGSLSSLARWSAAAKSPVEHSAVRAAVSGRFRRPAPRNIGCPRAFAGQPALGLHSGRRLGPQAPGRV